MNIPFWDELCFLNDFDMSSVSCASITESLDSSDCNDIDRANLALSLETLLYSYNTMTKELCAVNLDTDRIQDELVRVRQ
jgi:hypothetical protein